MRNCAVLADRAPKTGSWNIVYRSANIRLVCTGAEDSLVRYLERLLTRIRSRRPLIPKTPTASTQRLADDANLRPIVSSYAPCRLCESTSGPGFSGSAMPMINITWLCDLMISLLILMVSGLTGRPPWSYCWFGARESSSPSP